MIPLLRALFGRRKVEKTPEVDLHEVIAREKAALDGLGRRQVWLETRLWECSQEVRQLLHVQDRRGALNVLRQKKILENELNHIISAKLTIEHQMITLESAQTHRIAVGALARGVEAQKFVTEQMNGMRVEQLMETLQEQQEAQNDLSSILTVPRLADDAGLQAELLSLEAQDLEERLLELGSIPQGTPRAEVMPTVDRAVAGCAPQASVDVEIVGLQSLLSEDATLDRMQAELAL